MTDTPQTNQQNWLPWVAVAILGYFAFVHKPASPINPVDPKPEPTKSISKVLDGVYKQDRSDRLKTLKEFTEQEFKSDKEAQDWFNKVSTERRIETNIPYTDRVGKAVLDGKVKELATELESGK